MSKRPDEPLSQAFENLRSDTQGLDTMEPLRTVTRSGMSGRWPRLALVFLVVLAAVGLVGWLSRTAGSGETIAADDIGENDGQNGLDDQVSDEATVDDGTINFPDPNALVGSSWTLLAGGGPEGDIPLVDGWPITLTFDKENLGGSAACNDYGSSYTIDGIGLTLGDIGMNQMGCGSEIQESESLYLAALADVTEISVVGNELALGGPSTELIFSRNEPVPTGDLLDTLWLLDSIVSGEATSSVAGDPAMLIINSGGTLSGSTGCRTFSGRYIISGNAVLFNEFAAGETTCPDTLREQDGQVFGVLGDGFTAEVNGDRLTVTSSGNEGLVYRAITEDELAETPSRPTASDAELLDGIEWVLVAGFGEDAEEITILDPRSIDPDQVITLAFSGGSFSGQLVCNSYGGDVEIGSGSFSFAPDIFSTRVGCPPAFSDTIDRYTQALPLMTEFGLEGNGERLVMNGSGVELHFERLNG